MPWNFRFSPFCAPPQSSSLFLLCLGLNKADQQASMVAVEHPVKGHPPGAGLPAPLGFSRNI